MYDFAKHVDERNGYYAITCVTNYSKWSRPNLSWI